MKFEQEKVNFANSDRIEANDPQFLTFRHTNQNNTGRSIYSQKIEMYKSLQKKQFEDEESHTPVRNFKKTNLRSIRSQQKYQGRQFIAAKKSSEFQNKKQNEQNNIYIAQNGFGNQFQFRNQLLRKKIHKIIKNIKNEQKKEVSLEKDIQQAEKQVEDDEKQIQNQIVEIDQLQAINQQNQTYLQKLVQNMQEFESKNNHLQDLVQKIQESLQNLLKTSRQEDSKMKMAFKLKEGLSKLQNLRTQVSNRCLKMQNQIQKMKEYIQQTQNLDISIRDMTYSRQTENNSHFTC